MSDGTPPARPDDAINTRWLFPKKRAPSPPRDKGCKHNVYGDLALLPGNGSPPPSSPTITTSTLNVKEALNSALSLFQQKVTDITSDLTKDIQRMDDRLAQLAIIPHRSPSSTTMWMSLPAAAGLPDSVADTTIRIEEVCACQDALLEALMGDFRLFADDLVQRQLSTHAACASINDDDDNDKDVAIHIVPSIADADVKFKDIAVASPPLHPFSIGVRLYPSWRGMSALDSQHAVGF